MLAAGGLAPQLLPHVAPLGLQQREVGCMAQDMRNKPATVAVGMLCVEVGGQSACCVCVRLEKHIKTETRALSGHGLCNLGLHSDVSQPALTSILQHPSRLQKLTPASSGWSPAALVQPI